MITNIRVVAGPRLKRTVVVGFDVTDRRTARRRAWGCGRLPRRSSTLGIIVDECFEYDADYTIQQL
jgi:hypothetical protein